MTLNKRQDKIIMMMKDLNEWITGKELSKLLNVSDRTIRSDIDAINRYYGNPLVQSNLRYGYRIDHDILRTLHEIIAFPIAQTPQERCIFILQELLFTKNEININTLQDKVFVSEYSIDNDLKKIKKIIESFSSLKLIRSKNFIHLEGDEGDKRKLYKELLTEETEGNFLNLNQLASLYKDFDLILVKHILDQTIEKYNFHIREVAYPMLMIHIGIAIERIIRHNFICNHRKNDELFHTIEYTIAKDFFHEVSKKIRIEIVEDEIVLLTFLLMGKKGTSFSEDYKDCMKNGYTIEQLIQEVIEDIYVTFDIDFRKDMDLKVGLQMHLQSMMERKIHNVEIVNIYLQEIKRKYPLVFEMGVRVGQYIEEHLGIIIGENELGFLSLHLGSAFERANSNNKYRICMIYPHEQALSNMCMKKIESRFGDRLIIVESLSYFEEDIVCGLAPDIILSTLPLKHKLDIPTVQISLFVNYEDESRIFQTLNALDKKKFQSEFKNEIARLISADFFYIDLDLDTPEEVINYMCDKLYDAKYIGKEFKASVLQREKMSATSFTYSFAVPHSFNVASMQSNISVAILKRPIKWGNYDVKLVILLAINEVERTKLRIFFDWLSNAVSDTNRFSLLLGTRSYQEFINKIVA